MKVAIIFLLLAATSLAQDSVNGEDVGKATLPTPESNSDPLSFFNQPIHERFNPADQLTNNSRSLYTRISQKDLGNGTTITHNQRRLEPIECPPILVTQTRLLEQPINHTTTSTSFIHTTQTETEVETIHITKEVTSQKTDFITRVTKITKDHIVTETETRHTTLVEYVPTTTTETTIQRIVETSTSLVTKTNTLTATETNIETTTQTSTTTFTEEVVEVQTVATFTTSTIDHFSHTTSYSTEVITLHLTSFVPSYVTITQIDKTIKTVCPANINLI